MKNHIRKITLSAICLAAMSFASIANAQPTATQLVEQVKANYAQCQSYQDSGKVTTVFITEQGKRTVVKPFTTAFVRPNAFRYEFLDRKGEEEWTRYIVWQQGTTIKSLWTLNGKESEFTDLSQALAGAVGVSGGSATLISSLLLPDAVRGGMLRALTNVTLAGEDVVDKLAAYKLEAQDARGQALTLWVDKARLLVLKIFQKKTIDPATVPGSRGGAPFETETTTTFNPTINENIAAARLEFLAVPMK